MVGYYIRPGYSYEHDQKEIWKELLAITKYLCDSPYLIAEEACNRRGRFSLDEYNEYAKSYKNCTDLTIKITDGTDFDKKDQFIQQYASGGNPGRSIKEDLRRAFCLLVLRNMNEIGMNINISVS